jgi:hypothetical protein
VNVIIFDVPWDLSRHRKPIRYTTLIHVSVCQTFLSELVHGLFLRKSGDDVPCIYHVGCLSPELKPFRIYLRGWNNDHLHDTHRWGYTSLITLNSLIVFQTGAPKVMTMGCMLIPRVSNILHNSKAERTAYAPELSSIKILIKIT